MRKIKRYWLSCGAIYISLSIVYASEVAIKWVHYQNPDMGFSMQVPRDWKVTDKSKYSPKSVVAIFSYHIPSTHRPIFCHIGEDDAETFSIFEKYRRNYQPGYQRTTCQVDGEPATQMEGTWSSLHEGHIREIFVKRNGKYYDMSFSVPYNALWKVYGPIFETMLASFKFSR
jgi:hypothetical protein